jgi:anti-sigma factor (TIGR02949 family)
LTCRELLDFLMAYLDGELGSRERERFDRHLEVCPDCVRYLETYRETIRLERLCREPDAPVPGDVPEELVRAVLAARRAGK